MKLLKSIAAIIIVGLFALPFSACEKDDNESCEQQDMSQVLTCDGEKNVEVCCVTGASCTYKFNGQDYPDTNEGLNALAEALGCTYKSAAEYDEQKQIIIQELIALKDRAWRGVD